MCKVNQFPTLINQDGMAVVGRTLHDLRGIRFAEGDGGNGGDGGDGAGDEGSGEDEQTLSAADAKALRQQADKRMQERNAARDEAKAYKSLGLTPAEIKTLVDARDKAALPDEQKIRDQAQRDAETAAKDKFAVKLRGAEVRAQAAGLNFIKPEQALALLDSSDLANVDVDDDDNVDTTAVKKLLEALATDSPHLIKSTDTTADHNAAGIGASGSGKQPDVRPGLDRMRSAYENTPKK